MMEPVLRVQNITKRFANNLANDHITFDLYPGEIHCLLGENGAGKSTLMNIIYGVYGADEGEIFLKGQPVEINSPRQAIDYGIGMVHQHFMLVPAFTVAENIVLGMQKKLHLNMAQVAQKCMEASEKYDLKIDPGARVCDLSVGEQQRVEILKALYREANILILDEPTAVLTPQETTELFVTLRQLVSDGMSIIFISHKLNEVMAISSRISILRRGKIVKCMDDICTCTAQSLSSDMVGRQVVLGVDKSPREPGRSILELADVSVGNKKGSIIKNFSLNICEGEIMGLAGVDGNGQSELVRAVTGLLPLSGGKITLDGTDMTGKTPRQFIDEKVGHIPEDRHAQGLVLSMSIKDNLFLETVQDSPYTKMHILQQKEMAKRAAEITARYDVRMASISMDVGGLSGGNQQKVIVGRILEQNPKLLIAVHPTRGLDVGAIEFVHSCLLEARERGCAILLVSTELDEILELSDRIAVIYEGECMGVRAQSEATKDGIGMLMAGMRQEA